MFYTLFIADLHLVAGDEKSELFINFCKQHKKCSQLFILGDLFNTYLGDDISIIAYKNIIDCLQNLSKTTDIFILRGNRDFLIAQEFANKTGVKIIKSPYQITINKQQYVLTHGDELCTDDVKYQRFKKIIQNPIIKFIFLRLSPKIRLRLSGQLRQKSIILKKQKSKDIMDVNQQAVDKMMQKYPNTHLIHGHTHRQNTHTEKTYTRYVVGDWHNKKGNTLKIDANNNIQWETTALDINIR